MASCSNGSKNEDGQDLQHISSVDGNDQHRRASPNNTAPLPNNIAHVGIA